MEFTADTLLRWLEHLADKHKETKMREKEWKYPLAKIILIRAYNELIRPSNELAQA